ncbi:hypothetical protein OG259_24275 [Streptomyces sp. NBC_00250]|uniref:hypothetical protein n=1 Tax=Streptomyces sp. NBC_00250 TaxID=2903641 RepID=UPI002E2D0DB2|nr:hypothetical protein [Streptomyces sp. NBC_00250]
MGTAHDSCRRFVAAVALAAAAGLAGCTQHEGTTDPGARPAGAPTSTTPGKPAPSSSAASPASSATGAGTGPGTAVTEPPAAADWPDRAVTADRAPRLGKSAVIAPGYRADDFLTGLAGRWKVPLGKPRLIDAPGGRKVWHLSGGVPRDGERELALSGVPTEQGDLITFSCMVKADRAKAGAFLEDCVGTGIPGWDEKGATAWLDRAKKQVDALYTKERRQVVSSLYVSGSAHALLLRSGPTPESVGMYTLSVAGGGIAENS